MAKIARETIDVEALLVRAYRERQIDRITPKRALGIIYPREPGCTLAAGERVDTSSFAARMAAGMRTAFLRAQNAPDALLDLHDFVLALPDFWVERGAAADFAVWDAESAMAIDHVIDPAKATITKMRRRGGRGPGRDDLLPDGEPRPVARVVTAPLVILSAREAERPYVAALKEVGRTPIYRGNAKEAVGYAPKWETDPALVAIDRGTYAAWHTALTILAGAMAGGAAFDVTGPSAPAAPWSVTTTVRESRLAPAPLPPLPVSPRRRRRNEATTSA